MSAALAMAENGFSILDEIDVRTIAVNMNSADEFLGIKGFVRHLNNQFSRGLRQGTGFSAVAVISDATRCMNFNLGLNDLGALVIQPKVECT